MVIIRLPVFKRDYKKLSSIVKKQVKKSIYLLAVDFHHPSLVAKKMDGLGNIWEARITKKYRLTFQPIDKNTLILRRVGVHDILDKEK